MMEKAGMIGQLRDQTGGMRGLGKTEKVYLDNTNMIYAMSGDNANIGNVRETFFYNQTRLNLPVTSIRKIPQIVWHFIRLSVSLQKIWSMEQFKRIPYGVTGKYEVTIGIPVYNVGKYIRMSLESALAQTFESIEFLILDDCGTDDSMDIVRDYVQNHPRGKDMRIVRQPQNLGVGNGRNRIIDEAQGRYLYFMDSDDRISSNAIELLYNNARKYNAQIVYGSHERIEEYNGRVDRYVCKYPNAQFLKENEWPTYVYRKYDGIQAMTWNFLIDIEVYRQNHLRYKSVHFWEDFTFTMDLPTYVTRAVLLSDITYYYYCREGSLSNFQKRTHIDKMEIMQTANAVAEIKANSDRIRRKSYFPRRMYKLMVTNFYIVSTVFRHQEIISPSFTNQELHDMMRSPLRLKDILSFSQARLSNLILYAFWLLPASFSVPCMRMVAKLKNLI